MAAIKIKAGETLPLHLQLGSGATNKFVRAYLQDQNGVSDVNSPVSLPHREFGLYSSFTVPKSSTQFTVVTYRVYDDAAFTEPSFLNEDEPEEDGTDIFVLEDSASAPSRVDSFRAEFKEGSILKAKFTSDKLKASFSEDNQITAMMRGDRITGVLKKQGTLEGQIKGC